MGDPLLILIERGCRLGEQLPTEDEVLHSPDARDRARLIIAEMDKIDAEIRALGKAELSDEELISLYREAQDAGRNATQQASSDPAGEGALSRAGHCSTATCWSRCLTPFT